MIALSLCVYCTVPTAPRDLRLSLTQVDPPIVLVTWTRPAESHGPLGGYKLTYGVTGESYIEERRFDADKSRFTTGFLGIITSIKRSIVVTRWRPHVYPV